MWENYIYSCSSPGLFEYHSVVLIQSWPFIEYTVCSDIAVKDDVLTVMFLVELHNRLLISHVKCRGAYLLRLFDILHICRSVFFFFQGSAYVRGLQHWKLNQPGSCKQEKKEL